MIRTDRTLHPHEWQHLLKTQEDEIVSLNAEIQRLQRALAFWLPLVPADDSEIAERAGDDAMLLVGFDGDLHPCAEERGWITLRAPPQSGEHLTTGDDHGT